MVMKRKPESAGKAGLEAKPGRKMEPLAEGPSHKQAAGNRFGKEAWVGYDAFQKAIPHSELLQASVGEAVVRFAAMRKLSRIRILEIGPGEGATTKAMLGACRRAGIRAEIIAVDMSEEAIKIAGKNLEAEISAGNLKLVAEPEEGILTFLRKKQYSGFDVVASAWVLHNIDKEERKKIIPAIFEALVPGGMFVNADKYAPDDEDAHRLTLERQNRAYEKLYEEMGLRGRFWIKHNLRDDKPDLRMNLGESEIQLRGAGFSKVESSRYRGRLDTDETVDTMEAKVVAIKPL